MTRDWILSILEQLPVWCWPIFLWDVMWVTLSLEEMDGEVAGLFTFAVTRQGRIMVLNFYEADRPDPADWTHYAPRAPWAALDLAVLAAPREAPDGPGAVDLPEVPAKAAADTWLLPPSLDPG